MLIISLWVIISSKEYNSGLDNPFKNVYVDYYS